MKRTFLSYGLILLFLSTSSCKKTETSTVPNPILFFTLQADSFAFTFTTAGIANTTKPLFTWNTGLANVSKFVLNAQLGGAASQYATAGLNGADLFSAAPSTVSVNISKGDYTIATAGIVFSASTGTVYPLVLMGTYTNTAGSQVPFEFDLNDNLQVNTPVSNIIADGTKNFTVAVTIHLSHLLTSITSQQLDAATLTNSVILINKTTNTALYSQIKTNLATSTGTVLTSVAK